MHVDFSLHFTLKGQSLTDIITKFEEWNGKQKSDSSTLHHCFLTRKLLREKSIPEDVVNFLDRTTNDVVYWHDASDNIAQSRLLMMKNLKKLSGIAIFVGEIKEGVAEEFELAKSLNICIIHLK